MNDLSCRRHSVFELHVPLVFVSKYRRKVFDLDAHQKLRALFDRSCRELQAELLEMDGERDHVHLLLRYPPSVSISDLLRHLKGASSRLLRQSRPDLAKRFWKGVLWSPSYFASSCGCAHRSDQEIHRTVANSKILVSMNTSNLHARTTIHPAESIPRLFAETR